MENTDDHGFDGNGRFGGLLMPGLLMAGLAAIGWGLCTLSARRRTATRQKREDVGRWEGEGGSTAGPEAEPVGL